MISIPPHIQLQTESFKVTNSKFMVEHTLRIDRQGLTLTSFTSPTANTTYCDVVFISCLKTSQFMLCNTCSTDLQKCSIRGLGFISGNIDDVGFNTISTDQCPAHSNTHSSIGTIREANTGEGRERGGTWRSEWLHSNVLTDGLLLMLRYCWKMMFTLNPQLFSKYIYIPGHTPFTCRF